VVVSSWFEPTSLVTMIYKPLLFAGGDWDLGALFRRATKRENPANPVNPVKKLNLNNLLNPVWKSYN
jgi:hypothetical protein